MPLDRGLGVREREQLSKEAANKALEALVHSHISSDEADDDDYVKGAFEELASINKDQSATTAVLKSWGLAVSHQPCHHARLLLGLLKHHLQSHAPALKARTLVKPLKSLLRHISGAPDLKSHSSLIGEALAELVRENKFSQLMVLDIIQEALVEHPGDMERARCFGCLAAFYMRLASFHPASIIPMDDRAVKNCLLLLPQLLPEDMQARARCDKYFLGNLLHHHSLHPLPEALGLPSTPHERPRDPHGYFRGLLDKGQDPHYAPVPEYDPADLDPANCLPLRAVEWPTLEHACRFPQLPDDGTSYLGNPGTPVCHSWDRSDGGSAAAHKSSMRMSNGRVSSFPGSLPLPASPQWSAQPVSSIPGSLPLVASPERAGLHVSSIPGSLPNGHCSSFPGSWPLAASQGDHGHPVSSFPSSFAGSMVHSFSGSSSSHSSPDRYRQHGSHHSSPSHSSASSRSMADFHFARDPRIVSGPPASSSSSTALHGHLWQQSSMANGPSALRSPSQTGHVARLPSTGGPHDRPSADGDNPFTVMPPSQPQLAAAPSHETVPGSVHMQSPCLSPRRQQRQQQNCLLSAPSNAVPSWQGNQMPGSDHQSPADLSTWSAEASADVQTTARPEQSHTSTQAASAPARSGNIVRPDSSASLASPPEATAAGRAQPNNSADQSAAPANQADHSAQPGQRPGEAGHVSAAHGMTSGSDEGAAADVMFPCTAQKQPSEQHLPEHHAQASSAGGHEESHGPRHQAGQPLTGLPRSAEQASLMQPEPSESMAQPQAAAAREPPEHTADEADSRDPAVGDGSLSQAPANEKKVEPRPEPGEPAMAAVLEADSRSDADPRRHDSREAHASDPEGAPGPLSVSHGADDHGAEAVPALEAAEAAAAAVTSHSPADNSKDSNAEGFNATVLSHSTLDAHVPSSNPQEVPDVPAEADAGAGPCENPAGSSGKAGMSAAVGAEETADSSQVRVAADVQEPRTEQTAAGSTGGDASQATSKTSKKQRQRAKKLERELEQKLQQEAEDRAIEEAIAENAKVAALAAAQQPQQQPAKVEASIGLAGRAQADASSTHAAKHLLEFSGGRGQNGKPQSVMDDKLVRACAAKHSWTAQRSHPNAATSIEQVLQQHFPQQDIANTAQHAQSGQDRHLPGSPLPSSAQQSQQQPTDPDASSSHLHAGLSQAEQQVPTSLVTRQQQQEPSLALPAMVGTAAQQGQTSREGSKEQSAQLASQPNLASEPQQGQSDGSEVPNLEAAIEQGESCSQATKATQTDPVHGSSAQGDSRQEAQSIDCHADASSAQAQGSKLHSSAQVQGSQLGSQPPVPQQLSQKEILKERRQRAAAMRAETKQKQEQAPAGKVRGAGRTVMSQVSDKQAEAELLRRSCNLPLRPYSEASAMPVKVQEKTAKAQRKGAKDKKAQAELLEESRKSAQKAACSETSGVLNRMGPYAQAKSGMAGRDEGQKGQEMTQHEQLCRAVQQAVQNGSMRVNGQRPDEPRDRLQGPSEDQLEADLRACTGDAGHGLHCSDRIQVDDDHITSLKNLRNRALAKRDLVKAARIDAELERATKTHVRGTGGSVSPGAQPTNGFSDIRAFPASARSPGQGRLPDLPKGFSLARHGPPDWTQEGNASAVQQLLEDLMRFLASLGTMGPDACQVRLHELVRIYKVIARAHPNPENDDIHRQVALECSDGTGMSQETTARKYLQLAYKARKRAAALKALLEQAVRCVYQRWPDLGMLLV